MRRRSKIARLSGGAVGVENQLVVAQTQARQAGRLAALDGHSLRQDLAGTCLRQAHALKLPMLVIPCHQ